MSLKFFHIVFIVLATLVSLFVGVWGLRNAQPILGVVFLVLGAVLVVYGLRAYQKLRSIS